MDFNATLGDLLSGLTCKTLRAMIEKCMAKSNVRLLSRGGVSDSRYVKGEGYLFLDLDSKVYYILPWGIVRMNMMDVI